MKITFVGTGSGKVSLNQFHSSILISSQNYNLLVDTGDSISLALLTSKIDFNSIDGIVLTHLHPDHFSGLPGLIIQMKMNNRDKPLDVYVHKNLVTVVTEFLLSSYILQERTNFNIFYKTFSDNEFITVLKNFTFLTRKNSHLNKLQKYLSGYPSLNLHSSSLCIQVEDKKIIYTSDIASPEDVFLFKEYFSEVFICESNHIDYRLLIEALNKIEAKIIYLIHFSQDDSQKLNEILASMDSSLRDKIKFAKEGLSFEI